MRKDQLTTAKMIQIVTNLYNSERRNLYNLKSSKSKFYNDIDEFIVIQNESEAKILEIIKVGISKEIFIKLLADYGFSIEILESGLEDGVLLEGYVEDLEQIHENLANEDGLNLGSEQNEK